MPKERRGEGVLDALRLSLGAITPPPLKPRRTGSGAGGGASYLTPPPSTKPNSQKLPLSLSQVMFPDVDHLRAKGRLPKTAASGQRQPSEKKRKDHQTWP